MTNDKSRLFLIEFICTLVVFCVATAVCSGILAAAHNKSRESNLLDNAALLSSSIIETLKANDGDLNSVAASLGGRVNENELHIYYDTDFVEAEKDDFAYELIAALSGERLVNVNVRLTDAEKNELYSLSSSLIVLKGGEENE